MRVRCARPIETVSDDTQARELAPENPCRGERHGTERVRCARPIVTSPTLDLWCQTTRKHESLNIEKPCRGERHGTVRVRCARPIVTSLKLDL